MLKQSLLGTILFIFKFEADACSSYTRPEMYYPVNLEHARAHFALPRIASQCMPRTAYILRNNNTIEYIIAHKRLNYDICVTVMMRLFHKIWISRRRPFLMQIKDRLRTLLRLADGGAAPATGIVREHEFAEVANAMG